VQRGRSPLHIAASCNNTKVALALLQHADAAESQSRLAELLSARQAPFGWTALHIAAFSGAANVAATLLRHAGARGGTEQQQQQQQQQQPSPPSAVTALLLETKDATGCTALHHACASGHDGVGQLLLEAGAQRAARNGSGQDALGVASAEGRLNCMVVVLDYAADAEQRPVPAHELRGLEAAACNGEVVRLLRGYADEARRA
jgi:ankyrin repeat protein